MKVGKTWKTTNVPDAMYHGNEATVRARWFLLALHRDSVAVLIGHETS
jgi:hypothetical protein